MTSTSTNSFHKVIRILQTGELPLSSFIRRLFIESDVARSPCVNKFLEDLPQLLEWLMRQERSQDIVKGWMTQEYTGILTGQMQNLSKPENGFHLAAGSITTEKMKQCTIKSITEGIQAHAPDVWAIVGRLLESDPAVVRRRERERVQREKERKANGPASKRRKRSEFFDEDDEDSLVSDIVDLNEDEPEDIDTQIENRRHCLMRIVSIHLTFY